MRIRTKRQRGATVIEYAFLIVLLVVPLVEVTDAMQDQQGETILENGTRAGTPAEYSSGVAPSTPPPTFDDGDAGSGDTGIETSATLSISGTKKGKKKWTAAVVIAATDASGPVSGGVFEGTWDVFDLDGTLNRTIVASCTIDTGGNCTLSLANLDLDTPEIDHSVAFTITDLTSDDLVAADGVVGSSISIEKTTL
jgi:Flp pilus assembly pilin Flp